MKKLDIIYEDKNLLVINKPSGMLTISTDKVKYNTLYHEASLYVKKQNPKYKVFIVHRLDKDTSGIVILAKNESIKHKLQDNWNNTYREYIGVVSGVIDEEITLKHYLKEDKTHKVYVTNNKKDHLAITHIKPICNNKKNTLVSINIETGKKHQIRVGLAYINHPIIGDKKYGNVKYSKMLLHASLIKLTLDNKEYEFRSIIPSYFPFKIERS